MTNTILWQPTQSEIETSHLWHFIQTVNQQYHLSISDYASLYQWSIDQPAHFWKMVSDFCEIIYSKNPTDIIQSHADMRKTKWFVGATLNFAENLLRRRDQQIALIAANENGETKKLSYQDLFLQVEKVASFLKKNSLQPGDRVAGFVTNRIESVVAMLASASLGAIWTACSPEFGVSALIDRFSQIQPKILFAVTEHIYQGKKFQHDDTILQLQTKISSIKKVILIEKDFIPILNEKNVSALTFTPFPFDHPLYILYSSGTTGKPKCMVHGAGNILIQHLKELMLHTDLHENDTIFFYTTCSWMMWHWLISSLAVGATLILYDGSPFYPKKSALFDLIDAHDITIFGCGAKIIEQSLKEQLIPRKTHRLKNLKTILTTGSPLLADSFYYLYDSVKKNMRVSSISGGSDIVSCFALGNPMLPVYAEELQCRGLGMSVKIFNENGQSIVNQPGELVCTKPAPSMPIYFWNDPDGQQYFHAYFDRFPHVWTHGDYAKITEHGGLIIFGRSDATLNPGGVRVGTADIYEYVLKIPDIIDCVAVGQQWKGDERIILFVKMAFQKKLTDPLIQTIKKIIRDHTTPFHVPKKIIAVSDIPKTMNGKTMEIAVKNIIHGKPVKSEQPRAYARGILVDLKVEYKLRLPRIFLALLLNIIFYYVFINSNCRYKISI